MIITTETSAIGASQGFITNIKCNVTFMVNKVIMLYKSLKKQNNNRGTYFLRVVFPVAFFCQKAPVMVRNITLHQLEKIWMMSAGNPTS